MPRNWESIQAATTASREVGELAERIAAHAEIIRNASEELQDPWGTVAALNKARADLEEVARFLGVR